MTPFGHSTQLRVFIDSDLLQYDEVWAAACTWNDVLGTEDVPDLFLNVDRGGGKILALAKCLLARSRSSVG